MLGVKVAALRGLQSLIGQGRGLLSQFGNFLIDWAGGLVQAFVDIAKSIPALILAAITGIGDAAQIARDMFFVLGDAWWVMVAQSRISQMMLKSNSVMLSNA